MKKKLLLTLLVLVSFTLAGCNNVEKLIKDNINKFNQGNQNNQDNKENNENNNNNSNIDEKISEAEAVGKTIENKRVVIKYNGDDEGFAISRFDVARQYWVFEGFKDGNKIDIWKSKCRIWYFYDDKESFEKGYNAVVARYGENYIKTINRASYFFTTVGFYENSWETYDDIIYAAEHKTIQGSLVSSNNYELVK